MKSSRSPKYSRHQVKPGYISIIAVLGLSSILLLTLIGAFRVSVQSQDIQRQSQIRIDYAHREQALLRAVLNSAPNLGMRAMMTDSASDGGSWFNNEVRWRWVFEHSLNQANGQYALSSTDATTLGVNATTISGNSGNGDQGHIRRVVTPIGEQLENIFYITPGINGQDTILGPGYPEALVFTSSMAVDDKDKVIITRDKTYSDGSQYKAIPYPNVHFGYSGQDQTFVAKRNWWAFSVGFGQTSEDVTGIPFIKKDYVLSIYEVPSQLALGSTTLTYLGQHADGSNWGANVNVSGSIFASRATSEGSFSADRIATRKGFNLSAGSSVGGVVEDTFTGTVPTREEYEAAHVGFFPISSSSDSGLVAFIPINQGIASFDDLSNTTDLNRISPTGWNEYSRPALQCVMKLRIEDVVSDIDQTPTEISFTYKVGGLDTTERFTKGIDWPSSSSIEGASFPFHLDDTDSGRTGIALYVGRMATYLAGKGADSLAINNSIALNANYPGNVKIHKPNIPSLLTDNILILRDSGDLTAFTSGFSLVSAFRLYFANDVNMVSSGTDASGNPTYPQLSIFAPEKRFGVKDDALEIDFVGQLNFLGKDESTPIRPFDLQSGMNDEIVPENIKANLFSISDPSELAPVNQMNWLVTIEEVRP